jgi:hypothetical protein
MGTRTQIAALRQTHRQRHLARLRRPLQQRPRPRRAIGSGLGIELRRPSLLPCTRRCPGLSCRPSNSGLRLRSQIQTGTTGSSNNTKVHQPETRHRGPDRQSPPPRSLWARTALRLSPDRTRLHRSRRTVGRRRPMGGPGSRKHALIGPTPGDPHQLLVRHPVRNSLRLSTGPPR